MTHLRTEYKGYTIEKRTDIRMNTCIVYKGSEYIKGISGNIAQDGTENSIEKAKKYIDTL